MLALAKGAVGGPCTTPKLESEERRRMPRKELKKKKELFGIFYIVKGGKEGRSSKKKRTAGMQKGGQDGIASLAQGLKEGKKAREIFKRES